MRFVLKTIFFIMVLYIFSFSDTYSTNRNFRVNQIPNGSVNSCANCHINPSGGGTRNDFGATIEASFLDNTGNVIWNSQLAQLDSDGDGYTNGQELGDPFGIWMQGHNPPGSANLVSNPGDAFSIPPFSANELSLNLHFTDMTPHVGQQLHIRVWHMATLKEIARTIIDPVESVDFNVSFMRILRPGESYWIDFFADFNGNRQYDPPPTDHAWRIAIHNVQKDTSIEFSHHAPFADIRWPYLLTVQFSGMSPHVGQRFQMRLIDDATNREVGRVGTTIMAENFSLSIPGLEFNKTYTISFFADFNNNGLYDAPPTDHAWQLSLNNVQGDTTLVFNHNTNFQNIDWKYAATLQLKDMTPHVGQLFEARLVNSNGSEVNRILLDSIGVADFEITLGGLTLSNDYQLDFYADFNGNRRYNPPPTDHAWRITFAAHQGDTTISFTHNTNFTDIQYPSTTIRYKAQQPVEKFVLHPNYPNPFNPSTRITIAIPRRTFAQLVVYDVTGKPIATLIESILEAGTYEVTWTGQDDTGKPVSGGIYFYQLKTPSFVQTRKMLLLR